MRALPILVSLVSLTLLGCHHATQVTGDPLVLPATHPGNLLYTHVDPASVRVHAGATTYAPGTDYTLDPAAGTVARTPDSHIPDYSKNILYDKPDFDHTQYPGYGNRPFLVTVDYQTSDPAAREPLAMPVDYSDRLAKTAAKLRSGQPVKIIAFGDSITAGGEASTPDLQYPALYAAYLRTKFPKSTITLENGATGGDTTRNGLARLEEKVLTRHPDLVLVAFGMNDHNLPSVGGVPVAEFLGNLKRIVGDIRVKTGAEVIVLSCFDPNSAWHFGSHSMAQYAQATQTAADETHSAYANVYGVWHKVLQRKDAPSLLGNNINHPNDFGHRLYLQALEAVRF